MKIASNSSCFLLHSILTKCSAAVEKTTLVPALCVLVFFFLSSPVHLHLARGTSSLHKRRQHWTVTLARLSHPRHELGRTSVQEVDLFPCAGTALVAQQEINNCWHTQPSNSAYVPAAALDSPIKKWLVVCCCAVKGWRAESCNLTGCSGVGLAINFFNVMKVVFADGKTGSQEYRTFPGHH